MPKLRPLVASIGSCRSFDLWSRGSGVAEVTTFGREHRNLPRSIVEICSFFCHFLSCSIPWRILEFRVSALGMYVSFLLLSSVLCGSAPAISSMDEDEDKKLTYASCLRGFSARARWCHLHRLRRTTPEIAGGELFKHINVE